MLGILLITVITIALFIRLKKRGNRNERITLRNYCEMECRQNIGSKYKFCC